MANFQSLPIFPDTTGIALTQQRFPTFYHLNRFRISVAAPGGQLAKYRTIAAQMLDHMPEYMNPHTAKVEVKGQQWEGHKTLRFTGAAKLRPFSVPIYNPLDRRWIDVPVPEQIRDWAIPDVHTDWVGVQPGTMTDTGFTAQTLKRNFLDGSDVLIKTAALAALAALVSETWWNLPLTMTEWAIEEVVSAYVIWVNQHHFLAGRRSFRFVDGKEFGYNDGRWVFETAAMERFSLLPYLASEMVMGRAEDVVRPVWLEMARLFCKANHLTIIPDTENRPGWARPVGNVSFIQKRFPGYSAMLDSADGKAVGKVHLKLHP